MSITTIILIIIGGILLLYFYPEKSIYLPLRNGQLVFYGNLFDLSSDLALPNPPFADPEDDEAICKIHNIWAPYNINEPLGTGPSHSSIANPACGQEIVWEAKKLSILGLEKARRVAEDYFQIPELAVLTKEELFIAYPAFAQELNSSVYTPYNIRKAFPNKNSKYYIDAEIWSHKPLNFTMSLLGFLQRTTPIHNWTHENLDKKFKLWNKSYVKLDKHQQEELCLLSKGMYRKKAIKNGKIQSPCWGCSYGIKDYNVNEFGDLSPTLGRLANMFIVPYALSETGIYGDNGKYYGGTTVFMIRFLNKVDVWAPESTYYFKNLCRNAAIKIRWGLMGPLTFELACEGATQTQSQPCCISGFSAGSTLQPNLTEEEAQSELIIGSPIGGGIYIVNLAVVWHLFGIKGVAMYPGQRMPMTPEEVLEACPVKWTGDLPSICVPEPNLLSKFIDTLLSVVGYSLGKLLQGNFGGFSNAFISTNKLISIEEIEDINVFRDDIDDN